MEFEIYRRAQDTAKRVHAALGEFIDSESTELSIAAKSKELLRAQGITKTWYHEVPAFVLLGSRSCLSISGREYQPSEEKVGETNLVTVDLSPMLGVAWGDCARSYCVENGAWTDCPSKLEFRKGMSVEKELHLKMKEFVTPSTTFSELYGFGNHLISSLGYENLDFMGNLGHSIEITPSERRFIDKDCHVNIGSVTFLTFEPHIRKAGGDWGFKHEDIYYFNSSGRAVEL